MAEKDFNFPFANGTFSVLAEKINPLKKRKFPLRATGQTPSKYVWYLSLFKQGNKQRHSYPVDFLAVDFVVRRVK